MFSATGELVTLDQQDRDEWDRAMISEGHDLVRERLSAARSSGVQPGRYQLLAAINAVHTAARSADKTDWSQVVVLYDRLLALDPSPIVRLNRAVALAEVDDPDVAWAEIQALAESLDGYYAFHVVRADLLRRIGRTIESGQAYDRAIALATNPTERAHLMRRRDELGG